MRSQPNFRPAAAISSYAAQEAGNAKSFRAMRYYQGGFAERRDEILTERFIQPRRVDCGGPMSLSLQMIVLVYHNYMES